jgi:hypothetical protein
MRTIIRINRNGRAVFTLCLNGHAGWALGWDESGPFPCAPDLLLRRLWREAVNPPTEPAQGDHLAVVDGATDAPSDSMAPLMPGTGPTSFIGRWSADPAWCAEPGGTSGSRR